MGIAVNTDIGAAASGSHAVRHETFISLLKAFAAGLVRGHRVASAHLDIALRTELPIVIDARHC